MIKYPSYSNLFRNSGIYIIGDIISSSIPFILLPVLTRYLTPADYGIIAMFQITVAILFPIMGLSIQGAITIKYFDDHATELPTYIGNCLFLVLISSMFVTSIFFIFADTISKLSSIPKSWLWSLLFVALGQVGIMVTKTLWLVKAEAYKYNIYEILQSLFNVGLSIFLVVALGKGWDGRVEAQIATIFLFSITGFILLYKNGWLKFSYNPSYIGHASKYGIPLIPHELGGLLMVSVDRVLLANMVGITGTGIYMVGYQIACFINLIVGSFNRAYIPWLFQQLKKNDHTIKEGIVKFTYYYFFIILIVAIGFALIASFLLKFIVGKEFLDSHPYIIWISLAFAFNGMYFMVTNYILLAEKTHILAWVTFVTALINIPVTYLLIKINGAIGAAQAMALSFFLHFVLTWLLSAKVYKMPWTLKQNF